MKTQDVKLYAAQQLHRLQSLPDNQRCAPRPGVLTGMEARHACGLCGECSAGRGQAH